MNYSALPLRLCRQLVEQDLRAVIAACGYAAQRLSRPPLVVKVILGAVLPQRPSRSASRSSSRPRRRELREDSTGRRPTGANVGGLALLRRPRAAHRGWAAQGRCGIRTVADGPAPCSEAGADRLGTSATAALRAPRADV